MINYYHVYQKLKSMCACVDKIPVSSKCEAHSQDFNYHDLSTYWHCLSTPILYTHHSYPPKCKQSVEGYCRKSDYPPRELCKKINLSDVLKLKVTRGAQE